MNNGLHRAAAAAVWMLSGIALCAGAAETFRNTVDGQVLDLSKAEVGDNPDAVEQFEKTGRNPLNGNAQAIQKGKDEFLVACAGCHGHHAKGKIGPSLVDDYWTYETNETDAGLFSTIYGGARAQMGPHYMSMTKTQMLESMAYIRDIYEGKASKAKWLTLEQKKALLEKRRTGKADRDDE
ncbi:cytochrome c(L), periplasmic [Salinisphaera sp. T31B1]|uniref:cytochrome c(L), periplasmic n=1 Tax=Salinisphaera sp. T31B1 TaxID=727963 RepID=UPI00334167B0